MSLDFGMISRMIVHSMFPAEKEERFQEKEGADKYIGNTEWWILTILTWTISFLLSFMAFWLSWSCNTAMGYHVALKALFGAMAFFFGLTYIVMYIIMRWDVCSSFIAHSPKMRA
jgi:hypothetical protein